MRPHVRAFFQECAKILPCPEPIVEIGSFRVPGQEMLADLRPFFPGKKYVGCDMQPGLGVDRIEDIHCLRFANGEVGSFLLADTLEHVLHPFQAFQELHRCLREDGVVIFTSVMHFPIHSYPSDYWRFTPEAFRELARAFPTTAIFTAGDDAFPHSVCGVAAKAGFPSSAIRNLVQPLVEIVAFAPPQFEEHARRLIHHLALKLVPGSASGSTAPKIPGMFDHPFNESGWALTTGQWLSGWVIAEDVRTIEVLVQGRVLQRTTLTRLRPELQERFALDLKDRPVGFQEQVDLSGTGDLVGALQLVAVTADGQRHLVCESAPGLLLGAFAPKTGFTLYGFDERPPDERRSAGRKLIEALRALGEPVVLDLGCGFRKQGNVGIDIQAEGTHADLICALGFEAIPLDDESVDKVICVDFLEHVPKSIYAESRQRMIYPVIELMNEIWRVLKPGGVFVSKTPCYPAVEVHRDPTHLSVWTLESMDYFCGKYPITSFYGIKTRFELLENRLEDFYLLARLRKPQPPTGEEKTLTLPPKEP
ncbi:MAG: class I SAM-dependent methyltransferase [Pirellulales bacterium]|nr:class I SAM-dependent methyltransferase [Pirellulales bacterium]